MEYYVCIIVHATLQFMVLAITKMLQVDMSKEFCCPICPYQAFSLEQSLRRHGRDLHGPAYRANLGVSDRWYEKPTSALRKCHICNIYIGDFNAEVHKLNAACIAAAAENSRAAREDLTARAFSQPRLHASALLPARVHGPDGDGNDGDDVAGGGFEYFLDAPATREWIPNRKDQINWGDMSTPWLGEVILSPAYLFGPQSGMPMAQRGQNWRLYNRLRIVNLISGVITMLILFFFSHAL